MAEHSAVLEVTSETKDSAKAGFQDSTGNSISEISNPSATQRSPSLDSFSAFQDLNSSLDLIFQPGAEIAIKVDDPQKHAETLETYVTYRIRSRTQNEQTENVVRRRYNHFKALRGRLCAIHPWQVVPPLPGSHPLLAQLDRYDKQFVLKRCSMLNTFLKRLTSHIILSQSEDLKIFLSADNDRLQSHFKPKTGLLERVSNSIQGFAGPEAAAAPPPRIRDPEFVALNEYLTALHDKLSQLRKLTSKLGKEGWELSRTTASVSPSLSAWSSRSGHGCVPSDAVGRACASLALSQSRASATAASLDSQLIDAMLYIDAFKERLAARDALHGAYVLASQGGPQKSQLAGDLHDRLEYASAALRNEAIRWKAVHPSLSVPTNSNGCDSSNIDHSNMNKHSRSRNVGARGDARRALLTLAASQVALHTESLSIWQQALRDANSSVQNADITPTNDSVLDPNKLSKPLNNGLKNTATDDWYSPPTPIPTDRQDSNSITPNSSDDSKNVEVVNMTADELNKKMAAALLNNL